MLLACWTIRVIWKAGAVPTILPLLTNVLWKFVVPPVMSMSPLLTTGPYASRTLPLIARSVPLLVRTPVKVSEPPQDYSQRAIRSATA